MLRACRALLKPGGRIAFATIYVAPGVSAQDYRRAARARGRGAASTRSVVDLLDAAGFVNVRELDVTKAFARTTRAYFDTSKMLREALRAEWGAKTFDERLQNQHSTLALIKRGVLRRGIFTARRPN